MSRRKGVKNKSIAGVPAALQLSIEEHIELLANIIVDRIIEERSQKQPLHSPAQGETV